MSRHGNLRAQAHPAGGRTEGRNRRPWVWLAAACLAAATIAAWSLFPVESLVDNFKIWIKGLGFWGVLAFALLYVVGTLVLAPGSVMSLLAGLAFGIWGVPLVIAAATVAAALAFLIARHLARERVARIVEKHPKFKAVDRAVDEEGWKVVALLRLSPLVPFNLQNYAFGLTSVGFRAYVVATFFGIMPGTVLYVYLGAVGQAAISGHGGLIHWTFFAVGLAATIAVTWLVARKARQKLHESGLEPIPPPARRWPGLRRGPGTSLGS